MKSAGTSDNTKNNGRDQEQGDVDDDYENEPIVSHSIQHVWLEHPIPDKLFFLATGEGCGTAEVCNMQISEANCAIYFFFLFLLLQVQTVYESFSVENADSIYMASLEASLETDTTLFITLCIRYDVICTFAEHYTEVRFASFLSSGFTTMAVSNKSTGKETNKTHLCALVYV